MNAAWRAVSTGVAATSAFAIISATFRCCEGENGFARNVSTTGFVALGLLVVALVLHLDHRRKPVLFGAVVVAWWIMIAAVILAARASWDDYVFGRALHLDVRAMCVFATAVIGDSLLSRMSSRLLLSARY